MANYKRFYSIVRILTLITIKQVNDCRKSCGHDNRRQHTMTEEIIIFFQIVFIDLVLAGDNAIVIGMVASQFNQNLRKKIIFWGIGAAIVLRIIFTLITSYLLQINGLKMIGGLLLLYIAYKLYKDVIKNKRTDDQKIKADIRQTEC